MWPATILANNRTPNETALIGLEIAVSLIQAFVFTLLVCSYLKDAIELH